MLEHVTIEGKRKLAGIFYPASSTAPGVIFCHGLGSNKESAKGGEIGIALHEKGFNVLRFDFSGHGESEGEFSDVTVSRALEDVHSAISFMRQKTSGKIGLFGSSFGGMIALLETARNKEVSVLVVCAAPADMNQVHASWEKEELVNRYGGFGETFLNMVAPFMEAKSKFMKDFEKYNPVSEARKVVVPTLFLHGDQDIIVPLKESEQLFAEVKGKKELAVIPGADHFLKNKVYRKPILEKSIEWFLKQTPTFFNT